MPSKQTIPYNDGIYFITITCHKWIPLIGKTNSYDVIYKWFDFLKSKRHFILDYVLMPNHLHVLIGFRNSDKSINKIVGDGKRFIAYEIVKRLKAQKEIIILNELENAVEHKDRQRNKKHEVWEDSFDWKECISHKFINQKIEYMHNNPCTGKWNLSLNPIEYQHSSARFYLTGEHNYPVTNFMELDDVDLTKKLSGG